MNKKFLTLLLFILSLSIFAQDGIIKGKLSDKTTNDDLIGVNIFISELGKGTVTDVFGDFSMQVPAGVYTIKFSYVGYKTVEMEAIEVIAGEELSLTFPMEENSELMEAVVVVTKKDRSGSNILLLERKEATLLTQSIGAQELSQLGAGDAAEGLKKVVGLSVQGSKFVVVRGLGDRYNNSTLNGFPVASPNPDRRVLPYDIFPADILSNLNITKSFSPELYADFSGASVNIDTKEYPAERTLAISVGTSMNTQSTFKSFLKDPEASNDLMGFNQSREIPTAINDFYADRPTAAFNSDAVEGLNTTNFFTTKFDPQHTTAGLNQSYSLSYGDRINLKGAASEIGIQANLNYGQNFKNNLGSIKTFNLQGAYIQNFEFNKDIFATEMSGVANVTYKINDRHSIVSKNLYTHLSNNSVLETWGSFSDVNQQVYARRMTFQTYQLMANQLIGKHQLSDKIAADWGVSYSKADAQEPDRRQLAFFYDEADRETNMYQLNRSDIAESHRFFTDLNDKDITSKAQVSYAFSADENNKNAITAGMNYRNKQRDFSLRQYNYAFNNFTDSYDIYQIDEVITVSSESGNGLNYTVVEGTQIQDQYTASLNIYAPYVMGTWQASPKFQITAGTRLELAKQFIEFNETQDQLEGYDPATRKEITSTSILPSLILKYDLTSDHITRLSFSRTLSRPDFRELAPFEYRESFGAFRTKGNPELVNADNYNLDLRYEFIPSGGGLIAVGIFGKYLNNPIVQNVEVGATRIKSYQNGVHAQVAGAEVELRRNLAFISPALKDFTLNVNVTTLYTQIKINEEDASMGSTNQTSNKRQLEGASPFLINADLTYKKYTSNNNSFSATLAYNTYGSRLVNVGSLGTGDIFESSVHTLNMTTAYNFGKAQKWKVNVAARNLLNPDFKTAQDILDEETGTVLDTRGLNLYQKGVELSLGIGYRIF